MHPDTLMLDRTASDDQGRTIRWRRFDSTRRSPSEGHQGCHVMNCVDAFICEGLALPYKIAPENQFSMM
jgi:hypothetical protein